MAEEKGVPARGLRAKAKKERRYGSEVGHQGSSQRPRARVSELGWRVLGMEGREVGKGGRGVVGGERGVVADGGVGNLGRGGSERAKERFHL